MSSEGVAPIGERHPPQQDERQPAPMAAMRAAAWSSSDRRSPQVGRSLVEVGEGGDR